MAGIVNWPSFLIWTRIPSLADDSNCWTRTQRSIVYAKWAADANGPKKKRRNSRRHRSSVGTRYRGRSHHWTKVDPQDPPEDRRTTRASRYPRLRQHRGSPTPQHEFLSAGQSQESRLQRQPLPRPTIPIHLLATPSLPASRSSDDRCGYQEARTGGQLQE